jgi:hypothetical protein
MPVKKALAKSCRQDLLIRPPRTFAPTSTPVLRDVRKLMENE